MKDVLSHALISLESNYQTEEEAFLETYKNIAKKYSFFNLSKNIVLLRVKKYLCITSVTIGIQK